MKRNWIFFSVCLALFFAFIEVTQAVEIDLGTVNASFWGEAAGDWCGTSVSIVGDVNNDGLDDILIASPYNDYSGEDAGQIYLFFGKPTGWVMDLDLSNANASFVCENAGDMDWLWRDMDWQWRSVSGAGDVNGDGYDDILIAARFNDYGGVNNRGQVYLIFGKPTNQWQMRTPLVNSNASFLGEAAEDQVGTCVAGLGDVNKDGYDDFLMSATDRNSSTGETYLILGKASGWSMHTSLSNSNASFVGEAAYDYSGRDGAGTDDVNGDGYNDFLIGAHWNSYAGNRAGQAYLIFGKSAGWAMRTSLSNSNASFVGENAYDQAGAPVCIPGDINKDGYDDILISAGGYPGYAQQGQTYLIFGKGTGWAMRTSLANSNASFIGELNGDGAGNQIGAGDVNSDGFADFVLGAFGNAKGLVDAGKTYVILGKASGFSMHTPLTDADAFFFGENEGDWSSWGLASGGDVNGDGYDDILIGAPRNDEGGDNAGQTYLIYSHKIFSILDMGNDQGKQVRLKWYPSMFDGASVTPITQYGIWRRVDQYKGSFPGQDFVTKEVESFDLMLQNVANSKYGDRYLITKTGDVWDFIATVPAMQFSEYSYVAPTLADSTQVHGMYWSVFFVSAHTADPNRHFQSDPDSGYSLDNIPPLPIRDLLVDPNSWFTLQWTVPGEYVGEHPISTYDIRYNTVPIDADTQTWWNNATACTGNGHFNYTVGDKDSFEVLKACGCHPIVYFAIKGLDDRPNYSEISNIVRFKCGDANGDKQIDAADVVYLVNYLYIHGPSPEPMAVGDVTCEGVIDAADVVYLINYLYIHGPKPCSSP